MKAPSRPTALAQSRLRGCVALPMLLLAALAGVAQGSVPTAERIETAIAQTNVSSGRVQALRLELSLQIGDRPAVATGVLVSHPTGLARLELHGAGDLVERHLLQGSELMVSRNGRLIDEYRIFLPPLFILQADSVLTLRAALESFDVRVDVVGLADCGEADCFVLGDPTREVPRPEPPVMPVPELEGMAPQASEAEPDGLAE